jgi:hypothetical protein
LILRAGFKTAISQVPSTSLRVVWIAITYAVTKLRWRGNIAEFWYGGLDSRIPTIIAMRTTLILLAPGSAFTSFFTAVTEVIEAFFCIVIPKVALSVPQIFFCHGLAGARNWWKGWLTRIQTKIAIITTGIFLAPWGTFAGTFAAIS